MSRRTHAPTPAAPGRTPSGVSPGRMPGIPSGEAAKAQLRRPKPRRQDAKRRKDIDAKQLTEQE